MCFVSVFVCLRVSVPESLEIGERLEMNNGYCVYPLTWVYKLMYVIVALFLCVLPRRECVVFGKFTIRTTVTVLNYVTSSCFLIQKKQDDVSMLFEIGSHILEISVCVFAVWGSCVRVCVCGCGCVFLRLYRECVVVCFLFICYPVAWYSVFCVL